MHQPSDSQKPQPLEPATNRLLQGLPPKLRDHLLNSCELVNLQFGTILCEAERPFKYVYFPLTAFISLVTLIDGHQPLEVGLIGNEGMLGSTLSLGIPTAPLRALVQGSGKSLRLSAAQLRRELHAAPALVNQLNSYVYVQHEQLAKTTACIHFHETEPRLARWLLMTHDRTHADQLHLTQEFLADMLGVRRSSVTVAAGALQTKKIIHYSRGEIIILDRKGLESAACECYNMMIRDYENIFS
ncbi:Crp/Fnr family transcriptional regulator [Cellvibrio fibrivorans]|uniref:CRP-like cAMP-binding protein n=1 Tax=Cellvibrio fibrivorans TaxID=126350 RepID=A0ABU1V445_9GAMM|nr:Crp/Fnr family transcriptional regulator [Cellvibrio fibrivorans]MDR7092194.1 CRP-like cAMP-binding protein [Cellvibrio fibrivorans]